MTNILSFPRVVLAALALGMATVPAVFAADPSTPSAPCKGGKHGNKLSALTDAEKAQLKTAKEAALAANPDLKTEHDALKQQKANAKGDTAFKQQKHDYKSKLRAAELKIDPTLQPIFAKLDAAKGSHKKHTT